MARQKKFVNDKYWPEVRKINSYAIFMGYLFMSVRGLGLLVFTWTTVVLLGGFVSILQQKDFWCLTVITLVQTAGVFDFLLEEKASDVGDSFNGLLAALVAAVWTSFKKDTNTRVISSKIEEEKEDEDPSIDLNTSKNSSKIEEDKEDEDPSIDLNTPKNPSKIKEDKEDEEDEDPSIARKVLASVLLVVQVFVLAIVLCPLAVLYVLGLYASAGISLWRLIQHDYGNPDGGVNLKPALNVLYSLTVAQGVVYGYRTIYDWVAKPGLVKKVAKEYSLETDLVSEYLDETVAGCMKDPSFARGRNLITYAVDLLMESKSNYGYISGVLILGRIILGGKWRWLSMSRDHQSGLLKQLLAGSASFSHVVQRLLETFGPTSPYSTEIRVRAARIVATVAGSIRLDHFPAQGRMMIQCISSLLDTYEEYSRRPEGYDVRQRCYIPKDKEEYYERSWLLDDQELRYLLYAEKTPKRMAADSKTQGYKGLVVQGLCILQRLVVNEDNCRIICNDQDLLSKAMSSLISYPLHGGDHHDEWCSIAEESLRLMKRLMATPPGETERKLRSEISGNTQSIIRAVKGILDCLRCQVLLKRQAIEVLLDLSPASIMLLGGSGSSSTTSIWILLHISLLPDYHFDRMCGSSTHFVKKNSDIARLAGEKLQQAMLPSSSQTEGSATMSMVRSVGDVIRSLATAVADAENNRVIRIHAATILEHLVRYYTKDDENLKQLEKAMTDVLPEVLKQIVVHAWGTREAGIQAVTEANNGGNVLLAEEGLDLEQCGGVPHDNDNRQGIQLQEALIQLCLEVYFKWIDEDDEDLTRQFNEMAANICSGQEKGMPHKSFIELVAAAQGKLREEKKRA